MRISLNVNDQPHVLEPEAGESLAEVIRTRLELTGTKVACGEGTCGSCTVIVDGRPVLACLTLAAACDGASVRTIESGGEMLERLQRAFTAEDGFQCGFCTPGQMMSTKVFLERTPNPTEDQVRVALSGNLCRCAAYKKILESVMAASRLLKA
jgi:aerobic-type carbon monoxide dehydrogenase small subunit (CoxS/CutS family)